MENKYCEEIDLVITRSLSGNATTEDLKKIEDWKSISKENATRYSQMCAIWEQEITRISVSDIQADKAQVLSQIRQKIPAELVKLRAQIHFYKLAAVLAFPLALVITWLIFGLSTEKIPAQLCEISAPKGSVSKCILPDGSRVWVNTNSSIAYDIETFNKKDRQITVSGEAFFEVSKDKEKPFIVSNALAKIVVTGTAFNVRSYPETKQFEAVLTRGSIEFHSNQDEEPIIYLKPGERVVYDSNTNETHVDNVDPELFSSWLNGQLIFKDATLNDLVIELERRYDIHFLYKNKQLGNYRFRGMFSYSNHLIDALEKMKKTAGIDYYIENKVVWLRKK